VALHQQPIDEAFRTISDTELAISHGYVVSLKTTV